MSAIKKLKQTYCKYLQESRLFQIPVKNVHKVIRPYHKRLWIMLLKMQNILFTSPSAVDKAKPAKKIEIDFDDGVKVNYQKFQGIEVIADGGKKQKVDLLAKVKKIISRKGIII